MSFLPFLLTSVFLVAARPAAGHAPAKFDMAGATPQ